MALYVVVHHRQDTNQPWVNSWLDDERIEAIQTTNDIGSLCQEAQLHGEPVFVHRCAWAENLPSVCCSVKVAQAVPIDRRTFLVTFADPIPLCSVPPVSPAKGQNSYLA